MSDQSDKRVDAILRSIYYNPKTGYVGANKLHKRVKGRGITLQRVKAWLAKQEAGQVFKREPHKRAYFPITAPPHSYQMDLIFYYKHKVINNGYDTALTAVEITNRTGHVVPMRGKRTKEVERAFRVFLRQAGKVANLTTDKGTEWVSNPGLRRIILERGINHYTADAGDHNIMGMIERFNRTVKGLVSKMFYVTGKRVWFSRVDDLMENYNSTDHSSIRKAPEEMTEEDERKVRLKAQGKTLRTEQKIDLNVGDKVRLLRYRTTFEKEGPRWSSKTHTITKDHGKSYNVGDEPRRRKHYELQKVKGPVERVPQHRKTRSYTERAEMQAVLGKERRAQRYRRRTGHKFKRGDRIVAPADWFMGTRMTEKQRTGRITKFGKVSGWSAYWIQWDDVPPPSTAFDQESVEELQFAAGE